MANGQNTTAAIMAIPTALDPIRLVGDEDKHATLLFFGEMSTLPNDAKSTLTDAVKQASTMLFPFSESVVDVSRLGPESPPALVAMLSSGNLTQIRNLFMMNPSIKGYLDNVAQYPKFTPHVTLGYPDYTDETILRTLMKQIYRVRFDRLAVWWNDERIEFPLNGPEQDDISVAMSDITEKFLAHISEKPWSDYSEADYTLEQYAAACLVAPPKADLKSKSQCKLPVKTPDGALNRNGVHAAAAALAGARGGVKLSADERAMAEKKLVGYYKQLGEDAPASIQHSDLVAEIIADVNDAQQHGVKGMKWGVRRAVNPTTGLVSRGDVHVKVDRYSGKAKVKGGSFTQRLVARKAIKKGVVKPDTSNLGEKLKPRTSSEDQIHQDRIASKLASSGSKTLSNRDIQDFTRRLQLQSDLDRALAAQSAAAKAKSDGFIKKTIKTQSGRQFDRVLNKATDIAVEKALESAGLKLAGNAKGGNAKLLGDLLTESSSRLKPKKKGK